MLLFLGHGGLLWLFDLAAHLPLALGFLALAFVGLGVVDARYGDTRLSPAKILLVAAVLRLLLVPVPPSMSNDILRYLWDGRMVVEGVNPYLHAPDSDVTEALRAGDGLWDALDHRDVATVYPPLAQGLFAAAAAVPLPWPDQVLVLKVLLSALDVAACGGLVYLASLLRLPRKRVLAYAWNPLVTLEVAGMGHVDALGAAFLTATVLGLVATQQGRARLGPRLPQPWATAAAAAAGGVLAKLAPGVGWPMWARQSGRPWRFLVVAAAVTAVGLIPVVWSTGGVPPGLVKYGVSWEFNGPVYEPLWRLLEVAETQERVEATLDRIKEADDHNPFWNRFYPFNYPQLHAKLLLALGVAGVLLWTFRRRDPVAGTGALFGGLLLCSATVYPWYLLWVLPWAALARQPAWLALSALLPLSYLASAPGAEVPLLPWVYLAVWAPFVVLWALHPRWSTD